MTRGEEHFNFVLDVLNLFFSQIIFQITKFVVTGIRCEQFDHKNEVIHKETLKSKQLHDDSSTISTEDRFKSRATSDSPFVPAWIFCTRYSDRPASGTVWITCEKLNVILRIKK